MCAHDPHISQGYFLHALMGDIAMATSYLSSTNNIATKYATTPSTLISTPDGSHIISHLRKGTSTQLTNLSYP
jgi:hypothetical protein